MVFTIFEREGSGIIFPLAAPTNSRLHIRKRVDAAEINRKTIVVGVAWCHLQQL